MFFTLQISELMHTDCEKPGHQVHNKLLKPLGRINACHFTSSVLYSLVVKVKYIYLLEALCVSLIDVS